MTVTNRPSFQGDLMIRRIDALPEGLTPSAPEKNDQHILAHSETGHHHVIEANTATRFIDETNAFISYLEVLSPAEIVHLRDHDTHGALSLEPGVYEIRTQREYVPDGWRRAVD